jgi:hypothetical protein
MADDGAELFDFAFERPAFRRGKLRGGAIGSRRRGGNRTCMGRCGMCSLEDCYVSLDHHRKRQGNWSKKKCEIDLHVSGSHTVVERYDCVSNSVVIGR